MAKYRLLRTDIIEPGCVSLDTDEIAEGNVLFFGKDCICSLDFVPQLIPRAIALGIIEEVPEVSQERLELHERAKQIQRDTIPHPSYEEAVILAINEKSPYTDEEIVANAEICIAELQELLKKKKK